MSPILDHSGTHPPSLLGLLSKSNPAVVASATDVVSALEQLIEVDDSAVNVTTATVKHAHPVYLREPVARSELDPWFHKTIAAISSYRGVKDGWDGHDAVAPSKRSLDTAEMLAVFLSQAREDWRPVFSVDALGRPSFSSNSNGFYLHLTVDEPGKLTWFAELDGVEHFQDDVPFNGRRLPESLQAILHPQA
jgi:hypothetical protein